MSEAEFEALQEQKRKNQAARELIRRLMEEEPDDGEEDTWPQLEQMLRDYPLTTREVVPQDQEREAA